MSKILVTGGAGFIGSHIADALVGAKHEVRIMDDFSTGKIDNVAELEGRIELMQGDVSKKEDAQKAMKGVDYVFHEAAITSVVESFRIPHRTWDVNIRGTKFLLNEAEKLKVKRFVFASSAAVYGNDPKLPKTEDMIHNPISPYGNSKSIAEATIIGSHERFKLKGAALRYFNVYGPRQDPNSEYSGVITKFIKAMVNGERPTIYGDGEQTRDFVYVEDVVRANLLAMEKDEAIGQVFNIGTGKQTSLNRLVATINEILGTKIEPEYGKERLGDIKNSYADISKAKKMLGYEPKYSLKEGLEKTIEWFKKTQGTTHTEYV